MKCQHNTDTNTLHIDPYIKKHLKIHLVRNPFNPNDENDYIPRMKFQIPSNDFSYLIEAKLRYNSGKYASQRIRDSGYIPCCIKQSKINKVLNISVEPSYLENLRSYAAFQSMIVEIKIPNYTETIRCLVKNIGIHPGTNRVTHVQFLQIEPNRDYKIKIPVHLHGIEESKGIKQGGFLLQPSYILHVLYRTSIASRMGIFNFPSALQIEVSDLDIESTIHSQDIPLPPFLEIASDRAKRHVLITFTKNFG